MFLNRSLPNRCLWGQAFLSSHWTRAHPIRGKEKGAQIVPRAPVFKPAY
ncbi:MAG: hypothetical protein RIT52_2693 [Pseudomonadota bacterium]|jgi:hypothetical protein